MFLHSAVIPVEGACGSNEMLIAPDAIVTLDAREVNGPRRFFMIGTPLLIPAGAELAVHSATTTLKVPVIRLSDEVVEISEAQGAADSAGGASGGGSANGEGLHGGLLTTEPKVPSGAVGAGRHAMFGAEEPPSEGDGLDSIVSASDRQRLIDEAIRQMNPPQGDLLRLSDQLASRMSHLASTFTPRRKALSRSTEERRKAVLDSAVSPVEKEIALRTINADAGAVREKIDAEELQRLLALRTGLVDPSPAEEEATELMRKELAAGSDRRANWTRRRVEIENERDREIVRVQAEGARRRASASSAERAEAERWEAEQTRKVEASFGNRLNALRDASNRQEVETATRVAAELTRLHRRDTTPDEPVEPSPPLSAADRSRAAYLTSQALQANSQLKTMNTLGDLGAISADVHRAVGVTNGERGPSRTRTARTTHTVGADGLLEPNPYHPGRLLVWDGTAIAGSLENGGVFDIQRTNGQADAYVGVLRDYTHLAAGVVEIRDVMLGSSFFPVHSSIIRVKGTARFEPLAGDRAQSLLEAGGGASPSWIQLHYAEGYEPAPGDVLNVLEARSMVGRPGRFAECRIDGRNDFFWGVDVDVHKGVDPSVRLIGLKPPVPALPAGRVGENSGPFPRLGEPTSSRTRALKKGLVIVTHGTGSKIDPPSPGTAREGLGGIADAMAEFARVHDLDSHWDITTFDWREFCSGPDDKHGYGTFDPFEAARIGRQIGMSLADWLLDSGFDATSLEEIHIMGHSSGSWLIDGFAKRAKERSADWGPRGAPRIQLTFFDIFMWPSDFASGWPEDSRYQMGAFWEPTLSDTVEHYIDGRLPGTRSRHPSGTNIELVWLDPDLTLWRRDDTGNTAWSNRTGVALATTGPLLLRDDATPTLFKRGLSHPSQYFEFDALDSLFTPTAAGHAWPYLWYLSTINHALDRPVEEGSIWCRDLAWKEWGFVRSPLYRDFLARRGAGDLPTPSPVDAERAKGSRIVLPRPGDCR